MARTAEEPIVVESAFPAAVRHGNDVIRFPPGPLGAPALARGTVGRRRLGARPFGMRLDDVQAAQTADALVALLDFPPHVPGAAADLPFVHARVAAERAAGGRDPAPAPAADGGAGGLALGPAPPIRADHAPGACCAGRALR